MRVVRYIKTAFLRETKKYFEIVYKNVKMMKHFDFPQFRVITLVHRYNHFEANLYCIRYRRISTLYSMRFVFVYTQ